MNPLTLILGLAFSSLLWWGFLWAVWPSVEDYTDTGVGCIDDCLEVVR